MFHAVVYNCIYQYSNANSWKNLKSIWKKRPFQPANCGGSKCTACSNATKISCWDVVKTAKLSVVAAKFSTVSSFHMFAPNLGNQNVFTKRTSAFRAAIRPDQIWKNWSFNMALFVETEPNKEVPLMRKESSMHYFSCWRKRNATSNSLWFHWRSNSDPAAGSSLSWLWLKGHNRSCVALFHCWFEATWTTQKELHVRYKSPNELKIGPGYISDGPKTWKIATIMTISYPFHHLHPSLQLSPHFGRNHHSWVPGRKHPSTAKEWLFDATSTYLFI